jgi:hypothetical protein
MKLSFSILTCLTILSIGAKAQSGWRPLGVGNGALNAPNGVYGLVVDKNHDLYASGGQDTGGYFIAKWSGTSWQKVGNSLRTPNWSNQPGTIMLDSAKNIFLLVPYKNTAGKHNISKWDGTSWQELGTGTNALDANDDVRSLATDKAGNIYAFGNFTDSSGPYVAKWNGATWTKMGSWPYPASPNYGHAYVYVDNNDNIFATGFGLTNSYGEYYIAQWTTNGWQEVGAPNHRLQANWYINTMVKDHQGNLYVAGAMRDANGNFSVAKWDGSDWSPVGTNSTAINSHSYIGRLAVDASNRLYANSTFSGSNKQYVAVWNDTTWKELGASPYNLDVRGYIFSIATDSNTVYASGALIMDTLQVAVYGPLPAPTKVQSLLPQLATVVYPNPTQGTFETTIPLATNFYGQPVTISLLDGLGKQVFRSVATPVSGKSIRTQLPADLSRGNYTLCVNVAGTNYVQKITLAR